MDLKIDILALAVSVALASCASSEQRQIHRDQLSALRTMTPIAVGNRGTKDSDLVRALENLEPIP